MTKWRHEQIYDHEKKKTSCTKHQNIWHHPHVHYSPPSSNYLLIPRIPKRKGTRMGNGNSGIGWRCIYDHQSIAVCKYTYSNSPNIETSTFSSTYDSFYLSLAQTKPTVLYIHTFPSPPLASPHPFTQVPFKKGLHKHTTNYPLPSQSVVCRQSLAKTPEFLFMHLLAKKKRRKIRKSEISTVEPSITNPACILHNIFFCRANLLERERERVCVESQLIE